MHDEHHASSQIDRLVMMANQIARAFAAQGEVRAVPQIAEHIRLFWTPPMRAALTSHFDRGGEGLHPLVSQTLQTAAVS